jgi:hypothetical protein
MRQQSRINHNSSSVGKDNSWSASKYGAYRNILNSYLQEISLSNDTTVKGAISCNAIGLTAFMEAMERKIQKRENIFFCELENDRYYLISAAEHLGLARGTPMFCREHNLGRGG